MQRRVKHKDIMEEDEFFLLSYFLLMDSDKSSGEILEFCSGKATKSKRGQFYGRFEKLKKNEYIHHDPFKWVPAKEKRIRKRDIRMIDGRKYIKDNRNNTFSLKWNSFLNKILDDFFRHIKQYCHHNEYFTDEQAIDYKKNLIGILENNEVRKIVFDSQKWSDIFILYEPTKRIRASKDDKKSDKEKIEILIDELDKIIDENETVYMSKSEKNLPIGKKIFFPFKSLTGFINFCFLHILVQYMMVSYYRGSKDKSSDGALNNLLLAYSTNFFYNKMIDIIEIQYKENRNYQDIKNLVFHIINRARWEPSYGNMKLPQNLAKLSDKIPDDLIKTLAKIYAKFFLGDIDLLDQLKYSEMTPDAFFDMILKGVSHPNDWGTKNKYITLSQLYRIDIPSKLSYLIKG